VTQDPGEPGTNAVEPPPGMVFIPRADVPLGSAQAVDENPLHTVVVEPFYLDIYPVTNAAYAELVDGTGHRAPKGTGHRAPKHWVDRAPPHGEEDHPVVWLSWFDAAAYAKWAGKRLPTEDEWEYAARGTDGREYPWGHAFSAGCCNARATGLGRTSAVGDFPGGVSPFGCHDMAGNAWEWTASWADTDRVRRILRGGSWGSGAMSVRTCYRGRDLPSYWSNAYGVRCARSIAL